MRRSAFLIFCAILIAISGVSFTIGKMQHYRGDLARIGALPAKDFVGNLKSTNYGSPPMLVSTTPTLMEADVVVIGDSFSVSNEWQDELEKHGLKTITFHWDQFNLTPENPIDLLERQGLKPDATLVLQVVERQLDIRLKRLSIENRASTTATFVPKAVTRHNNSETENRPETSRMSTGLRLLFNQWRMARGKPFVSQYPGQSHRVKLNPMPDGCNFFSNLRCDWLVTLAADKTGPTLDGGLLAKASKIESATARQILWLIVPNKSTIYLRQPGFKNTLFDELAGPNLFSLFTQHCKSIKDLYEPDDSHLSKAGYRIMGQKVLEYRQKTAAEIQ